MKCSEFEKGIYLYDELTPLERKQIDAHVRKCTHCIRILNSVRDVRKVIALHHSETSSLKNHAVMTRGIMDAIAGMQQKKTSSFNHMEKYLRQALVPTILKARGYMTALSVFLVVFFFWEYFGDGKQLQPFKYYPRIPAKTELDLASFHTAFLKAKQENKQASIAISHCVARCLDTPASDCKGCADKFGKL